MAHTARTMRKAADFIVSVDPAFGPIVEESPLCSIGRKTGPQPDHFTALVTSVVGQQLSIKAADTINGRLHAHFGGGVTPEAVVLAHIDELRSVGLSGAKTRTIKELAHAIHSGNLDLQVAADHEDDHTIAAELTKFWGIGRWTAEMFLMFTLHRLDVWPVGDLAMRRGWEQIHNMRTEIDPKKLDALGNKFRPYRSVVAWYCWRVIDGDSASDTW
jgi:DNA-3-methyladenine glycosylase II